MRKKYESSLRLFFRDKLVCRRNELGITQEEMAYRLAMANRSYIELDHGKSCCSGLTLARFLIYICEDPIVFLKDLRRVFEKVEIDAA